MKQIKLLSILFVAVLASCGKDDGPDTPATPDTIVTTSDVALSIAEDAAIGDVIGDVPGTSNTGAVTFAITSQTPSGALSVDATSGELTVASVLNRETTPLLTADVSVTKDDVVKTSKVTVTVDIASTCVGTALAKWNGEFTMVDENFDPYQVTGTVDECDALSVTGVGFAFSFCSEPTTFDLTLVPSADNPNTGTVVFEVPDFECNPGEPIVADYVSGTYDLEASTITIVYQLPPDGPFPFSPFERTLVGDGGVVPENPDRDADGILNEDDNCPDTFNIEQTDTDGDGEGDVCDTDDDGDGIADELDNCPLTANENQADVDGDGFGDVCDDVDDGPCTSTIDSAVWAGFISVFSVDFDFAQADVIGRPGCGILRIEGDITDTYGTPEEGLILMMTASAGTSGTVNIDRTVLSVNEFGTTEIEGSGTYDEDTGIIEVTYEIFEDGFRLDGGTVRLTAN